MDYDILICDDHPICQMGLEVSLKSINPSISSLRRASSGQGLLESVKQRPATLIFLDLGLPDISGPHLIRSLREITPEVKIIVVTGCEDKVILQGMIHAKVDALLAKTHSLDLLATAIQNLRNAKQGTIFIDPAFEKLLSTESDHQLTVREWEVLELIAEGKTNRDIADKIKCSLETVKTHRANLGRKILARNRAELTAWYLQRKAKSHASFDTQG